jgi:nitrite reductase/ring-hydroxylating ferredoxin subunit
MLPSAAQTRAVDVSSIIRDGAFAVLDDFALRQQTYDKVTAAFLDGVEELESRDARLALERDGLRKLHEHFPVPKVKSLEEFVLKRVREDLYYWTFAVGRDTLGLPDPFYVDYLIMVRIHYPYLSAKSERASDEGSFQLREKVRLGLASLRNVRLLTNQLGVGRRKRQARQENRIAYDPASYHGNLPTPARSHGAHVDTWYGHSYDGINLWWAIDGVNRDNTVILYPDLFGRPLQYDPKNMYLMAGAPTSKPHHIDVGPGQLLVFNPETLHSTQVNISQDTRIALTTRLNPGQPRFNDNAPFNFEHWYVSTDLERKKFGALTVFPSHMYQGKPSIKEREPYQPERTIRLTLAEELNPTTPTRVCATADFPQGHKIVLDLKNAKLLVWHDKDGIRAFRRTCPHLGYDLGDGWHDDDQVFCPGHGMSFGWADGASHCDAFRLRPVNAFERDGAVYVQSQRHDRSEDPVANPSA